MSVTVGQRLHSSEEGRATQAAVDTRAGVSMTVPNEWSLVPLGALCSFANGVNADKDAYGAGVPFINVLEVITHTHLRAKDIPGRVRLNRSGLEAFAVRRGDVLFNRTSETQEEVGLAAVYDDDAAVVFGGFVIRGRFVDDSMDSTYVGYGLRSRVVRDQIIAQGQGAIRANVGQANLKRVLIPVPPKHEQRAIAEALSDVDRLIGALEALIVKKRAVKQAAMQQLLTGTTRLPGFSGQWETKRLGDVAHIKTGSRNNEDKVDDGNYAFFVRSQVVERINSFSYDCEAILVPGEGRIGNIFHYICGRFDVHQRVYAITKFAPTVSGRFVYFHMAKNFGAWAMQNTVKATVDSLRLPTFQNFEMEIPPTVEEQIAIAAVLSTMDADITSLERRRHKTRAIKRGMMQQLLTGRVRLVKAAPAEASA